MASKCFWFFHTTNWYELLSFLFVQAALKLLLLQCAECSLGTCRIHKIIFAGIPDFPALLKVKNLGLTLFFFSHATRRFMLLSEILIDFKFRKTYATYISPRIVQIILKCCFFPFLLQYFPEAQLPLNFLLKQNSSLNSTSNFTLHDCGITPPSLLHSTKKAYGHDDTIFIVLKIHASELAVLLDTLFRH